MEKASGLMDDYAKLKKEFKLPEYSLLDNEFEISTIETPGFLLRQIRRKIEERISSINHRIENVLHADSNSVSVLFESSFFTNDDKVKILEMHRKIMILIKKLDEADILQDEKKDADIIAEAAAEWPKLRKECAEKIFTKITKGWQNPSEPDEIVEYMG